MLGSFLFLLFGFQSNLAQENKTSQVHITITEDGKVTSDTTFELAEGQDPEMIKKVVSHMAGGDLHGKHMTKEVHVINECDHKMMKHEHMMKDINMDSIREAHPDAKVLVIKDENGKVTVKESDGEHEMHLVGEDHGEHHEMIIISSEDDGETVHVHKSKSGKKDMMKEHKVIILSDGDCEGKEKKIRVEIEVEEEGEEEKEMKEKKKKKK